MAAYGVVVTYNDIEKYLDETFYTALNLWQMTKLWGLGNGNIGWANEPTDYIDAITALESERITMENEETMKSIEKSKQSSSTPKSGKGAAK